MPSWGKANNNDLTRVLYGVINLSFYFVHLRQTGKINTAASRRSQQFHLPTPPRAVPVICPAPRRSSLFALSYNTSRFLFLLRSQGSAIPVYFCSVGDRSLIRVSVISPPLNRLRLSPSHLHNLRTLRTSNMGLEECLEG